jgi:hypothetical protein
MNQLTAKGLYKRANTFINIMITLATVLLLGIMLSLAYLKHQNKKDTISKEETLLKGMVESPNLIVRVSELRNQHSQELISKDVLIIDTCIYSTPIAMMVHYVPRRDFEKGEHIWEPIEIKDINGTSIADLDNTLIQKYQDKILQICKKEIYK